MVGVGVFGLPFAFSKSGFWVGFGFLVLIGVLTLILDLMYGEVVLRTNTKHQLVGYTKIYLGPIYEKIVFFSVALTGYAALLAYIIIAGDFLNTILSQFFYFPLATYSILFFVVLSLMVLKGIKTVAWLELILGGIFTSVIIIIFWLGIPKLNLANFSYSIPEFWFLPYGVLLFAFSGLLAVPIQREILVGKEKLLKNAIITAMLVIGALYFIFTFTVVGVSGILTTPDAVSGLLQFLGGKIVFFGSLFGIIAVSTSFLMLSSGLLEVYNFDFKLKRFWSWSLVVFPPLLLFLGGIRTFVDVISLAGSVAIALEGAILIILYIKAKKEGNRIPEYSISPPKLILYLIVAMFLVGMFYSLFFK